MLLSNHASKLPLSYTKIAQLIHSPLLNLNITYANLAYYKFFANLFLETLSIWLLPFWKVSRNQAMPGQVFMRSTSKTSFVGFPMCSPTRILFPQPLSSCNIFRCERSTAEPVPNLPIVLCAPLHAQQYTVYVDMYIWLSAIVRRSEQ